MVVSATGLEEEPRPSGGWRLGQQKTFSDWHSAPATVKEKTQE